MFWTTRGRVFFMGGVIVMITSRGCILGLPYFILGASLWKSSTPSWGKTLPKGSLFECVVFLLLCV
jgi:hypothetical protein